MKSIITQSTHPETLTMPGDELSLSRSSFNEPLAFWGVVPGPLRMRFKYQIERCKLAAEKKTGQRLNCLIPCGRGGLTVEGLDKGLPDILVSFGFERFMGRDFVKRNLVSGGFCGLTADGAQSDFAAAGCAHDNYTMLAVSPYVFLVDKKKLGTLPEPSSWENLLDPIYHSNIILEGHGASISSVVLHYIFRYFGIEGIKKLARNTKSIFHPAHISKAAGSASDEGAAVYAVPWFFAKCCAHSENTKIIWPSDGAFLLPVFALAKRDRVKDLLPLWSYLTGEFAQESSHSYCPGAVRQSGGIAELPGKIRWLGWDYIDNTDMSAQKEILSGIFCESRL